MRKNSSCAAGGAENVRERARALKWEPAHQKDWNSGGTSASARWTARTHGLLLQLLQRAREAAERAQRHLEAGKSAVLLWLWRTWGMVRLRALRRRGARNSTELGHHTGSQGHNLLLGQIVRASRGVGVSSGDPDAASRVAGRTVPVGVRDADGVQHPDDVVRHGRRPVPSPIRQRCTYSRRLSRVKRKSAAFC